MASVQDFYVAVREARQLIPWAEGHVTSLNVRSTRQKDGVVVTVTKENAARLIAGNSHRLSTDEEIAAYQDEAKRAALESERKRVTPMSLESVTQIIVAAQTAQAGQRGKQSERTA